METNETMYKCPRCDRLMSKAAYLLTDRISVCPNCNTSIVYFKTFKIDKGDKIEVEDDGIKLEIYIKDRIATIIKEVMSEEFERAYRDGYSRGYEEGDEAGYADGYKEGDKSGRHNKRDNK